MTSEGTRHTRGAWQVSVIAHPGDASTRVKSRIGFLGVKQQGSVRDPALKIRQSTEEDTGRFLTLILASAYVLCMSSSASVRVRTHAIHTHSKPAYIKTT